MFNQKGFTLIELLSVMVIMGVLASVTIKKFDLVSGNAEIRAVEAAVSELNAREHLTWTNKKLSSAGWVDDTDIFGSIETVLGNGFVWDGGVNAAGGTLTFGAQSIDLTRVKSSSGSAAKWKPSS
ncbi:MAG: type II secretion system protein [Deltaproteobacteria bacterium]|jgi:prepilin-type N-terminal cleavage/methylation domain-containing protein|nr:type II secretion system protein [Deltaproteobacteria bacterium]